MQNAARSVQPPVPNPNRNPIMDIRQGEHVLIAGQNGTGKTTLASSLARSRKFAIFLDQKNELEIPGFTVTSTPDVCFAIDKATRTAHHIFRPKHESVIPRIFDRAYIEGGWDVFVDEVYMLDPASLKDKHRGYLRGLTGGRSKYNTIWTLTQRPLYLPKFAMTEAKHVFVFELGFEDDRKYLLKNVGVQELNLPVEGHQFLYYQRIIRNGKPVRALYKSILNLVA